MHLVVWLGAILATWPVALHGLATEAWTRWPVDAALFTSSARRAGSGVGALNADATSEQMSGAVPACGLAAARRDASSGVAWRHVASRRTLVRQAMAGDGVLALVAAVWQAGSSDTVCLCGITETGNLGLMGH